MGDKYEAFGLAEGLVRIFPKLAKHTDFMKERALAAKPAFEDCLSGSWALDECLASMQSFLKVGTPNPQTAFELGKLVRFRMNAYAAMPFLPVRPREGRLSGEVRRR